MRLGSETEKTEGKHEDLTRGTGTLVRVPGCLSTALQRSSQVLLRGLREGYQLVHDDFGSVVAGVREDQPYFVVVKVEDVDRLYLRVRYVEAEGLVRSYSLEIVDAVYRRMKVHSRIWENGRCPTP
jgi:hypothetical protein